MSTTHIEVTLKEMLQMSLGAPKITDINLSILHSLFNILLKKLDCQYEKVTVYGLEGACIKSILDNSRISPLPFNTDKTELLSTKLEKLEILEEHYKRVAHQLEEHFEEIRICNKKNSAKYSVVDWSKYSGPCEWFCTTAEPASQPFCDLLENYDFIMSVKRIVEEPIVDYQRRLADTCERLAYIEKVADEISNFSQYLAMEQNSFTQAMVELQDMIDGKMHKIVLPSLKKYIQTETGKIIEICEKLKQKEICDITEKFSGSSETCLSCKGVLIRTSGTAFLVPNDNVREDESKRRKIAKNCNRNGPCLKKQKEVELLERLVNRNKTNEETKISREIRKSCKIISDRFDVVKGTNGVYYRKA
ncbi:uncharacterized protein LOC101448726 [Ceratitis capitata]|uniref:uncharacterized protein LOC101448726 n=1 Tax=Ceratitis capitata TaxID=7213 RepID=UPI0006188884|nr:uncharacterized protein LOC101448726 [Ceratitis capitata]